MRKTLLYTATVIAITALLVTGSCKKSSGPAAIVEPITIVKPDSLDVQYLTGGNVQAINIEFTTDRPIAWAKCNYEIDSPGAATLSFYRTFPDTLFYKKLDSLPSLYTNKYTYVGSYTVPLGMHSTDTIRFDVQMLAYGRYPNTITPDTVYYEKQFKLLLR